MARGAYASIACTLALAALACGDDESAAPEPAIPADAALARAATPPADASTPSARDAGASAPEVAYGEGEFHLDEPSLRHAPASPPASARRRVEITLRSTPPKARVLVDGEPAGHTPAYWEGEASGLPREFTFVLPGYEMARYRFVPTRSGIVHATLERLAGPAPSDAGPGGSGDAPPAAP